MQAPVNHADKEVEVVPQSTVTPKWTIHVSDVCEEGIVLIIIMIVKYIIRDNIIFSMDGMVEK
jgi:hypothetical protein